MADSKYSYDVFYRIGEGFGEHIQVLADGVEELMKGREELGKALIALGAGPLPRDIAFNKPAPANVAPTTAPSGHNPNRLPQNGNANSAPVCPECGAGPMIARRPDPEKGQTWNAFWGCREWRNTGCKGKRYM